MASPASIKKHPLHPMLVAIPIGLWTFALVCEVGGVIGQNPIWKQVALYCVAGGIVGAVLAAVPGLIDYLTIDDAEMKWIATFHLIMNLGALVVFSINLWCRLHLPAQSILLLVLSAIGVLGIRIAGWLGSEMVYVKGMAVDAVEKLADRADKVEELPRLRRAS
jgi:uncharacterized membrane protein